MRFKNQLFKFMKNLYTNSPITKRNKICFIVSAYSTVDSFLRNHILLLSFDYDIFIVGDLNNRDINLLSSLPICGTKSIKIARKINIPLDFIALFKLFCYFKINKFSLVHSITPKAGLLSMLAGMCSNINYRIHIFTGQVWANKKGFSKYFLKLIDKLIVKFATHILVDGNSQLEFLAYENILNISDAEVLGNGSISGVNTNLFKPNPDFKLKFKSTLGLNPDHLIILFVGRLNSDKGILDLIEAFKCLCNAYHNLFLVIVGFDEENLVNAIANELPANKFKYYGSVSNTYEFYQIADIFCMPSKREGFGTSLIEASSSGLPVVCSDIYGLRDSVIDNHTGFKHIVEDIDDLIIKLSILIEDPELRSIFARNGILYVNENFDHNYVSLQWKKFYSKLLS